MKKTTVKPQRTALVADNMRAAALRDWCGKRLLPAWVLKKASVHSTSYVRRLGGAPPSCSTGTESLLFCIPSFTGPVLEMRNPVEIRIRNDIQILFFLGVLFVIFFAFYRKMQTPLLKHGNSLKRQRPSQSNSRLLSQRAFLYIFNNTSSMP